MILSFKTEIDKKPTHFVEKIWTGLIENGIVPGYSNVLKNYRLEPKNIVGRKPKLHTIREDKNDRWQPGTMIDFYINSRTKNMFRFAPRILVISRQSIEIKYFSNHLIVFIDEFFFGQAFWHSKDDFYDYTIDLEKLAINDGFESVEDFFDYFNEDFKGKIIHWTDLKY